MKKQRTSPLYNFASALLAFALWGGWAYFVNREWISAVTQGVASFISTYFLVYAVSNFYKFFAGKVNVILQLICPAVLTVSFTGTCLYIAHRIAQTDRILPTIAPALTVAFLFCVVTTYKLSRETPHG